MHLPIVEAVPGALLNKAALNDKPSYFHDTSAVPYLPKKWFSDNLITFFAAKPESSHSRKELGLQESAPDLLALLQLFRKGKRRLLWASLCSDGSVVDCEPRSITPQHPDNLMSKLSTI